MKHNKMRKKNNTDFVLKRLLLLPLAHLAKYIWEIYYFFSAKGCARPFIKFKSQICIKISCCFSFLLRFIYVPFHYPWRVLLQQWLPR